MLERMNIVSKHTLFSNSATGSKHVQDGLSNEDSVLTLEHDDYQIVAVADGHGARECFRSEIGSRLAVDVAVKNLELFAQTIKRYDLYSYLEQEKERDELVRSLIQDIVDHWNQYVYADIKAYPIQDDEYERAQTLSSIYQKGMYLTNIYGSTLLAALMTPEYILIVQQGDGTCAVFNEDGSLDDPMPEDDLCIRNLTTSLCDKDAAKRMGYVFIDRRENDPMALFLASDGVERSFYDTIHLSAFYAELCLELCELEGADLETYLSHLLPQISERGSRDDVTMAGLMDAGRIMAAREALTRTVNVARKMDLMKSAETILKQETNTKKHYVRESEKIEHEIHDVDDKILELEEKKSHLLQDLEKMKTMHTSQILVCKEAETEFDEANGMFVRSLMALEEGD